MRPNAGWKQKSAQAVSNHAHQDVTTLILSVTCMAPGPLGIEGVMMPKDVQNPPQLLVQDWFLPGIDPTTPFPAVNPFGEALDDVFTVGNDSNPAGLLQTEQPANHRSQFHSIVRAVSHRPGMLNPRFCLPPCGSENECPASRAGIRAAPTICEELDIGKSIANRDLQLPMADFLLRNLRKSRQESLAIDGLGGLGLFKFHPSSLTVRCADLDTHAAQAYFLRFDRRKRLSILED